jgi:hypothetical protein
MLFGTVLSAIAGIGTAAYAAWKNRKAADAAADQLTDYDKQEQQRIIDEQRRLQGESAKENARLSNENTENKAWYDKEYYSNPLQTEEAQAALTSTREYLDEQNKIADSRAAITGGTAESRIAQRGQSAKAMGQLTRDLAAKGTAYKQSVQGQYWANKNRISDAQRQTNQYYSGQQGNVSMQQGNLYSNINNAKMGIAGQQMQSANNLQANALSSFGNSTSAYGKLRDAGEKWWWEN